jgi:hypothetical protein
MAHCRRTPQSWMARYRYQHIAAKPSVYEGVNVGIWLLGPITSMRDARFGNFYCQTRIRYPNYPARCGWPTHNTTSVTSHQHPYEQGIGIIDVDWNPSDAVPSSAAMGTGPHEQTASVTADDIPITAFKDLTQVVDTTTAVRISIT